MDSPSPEAPRSAKVDALFAGELPEPVNLAPTLRLLRLLLVVSLPMNLAGVLCWTGVPGAILTLWAWLVADGEASAVSAGVLDGAEASSLLRLRSVAAWNLGLCVLMLFIEASLLATPFYEQLLTFWLDLLRGIAL